MTPSPAPRATESQVLAVLAGTPLEQTADQIPMDPTDLADAVEVYQAAGRAALEAQPGACDWYQIRIQFTDWNSAEQIAATHLGPHLHQAQETGILTDWWFLRKHPCWRLRCRCGPKTTAASMKTAIAATLDSLVISGTVQRWQESLYESETLAFGGSQGMDIAHDLFHADSHGILTYLRHNDPAAEPGTTAGRRELSILLCTTLFRSAWQDEHEQGDIWHRVAQMRTLSSTAPAGRLHGMIPGLQRLIHMDTSPTGTLFGADGSLSFAAPWSAAFAAAGRHLADTARDGTLQRGLRDVLAHHVIFHWNRLGLLVGTQAVLARAARETLMNPPAHHGPANGPPGSRGQAVNDVVEAR
ncbi:MAG TPA: thiopeptide-type bacteriocin biosynthesis protein [Streptosporangiaceae bacterium]|nr:thiopeptide-type bacteriocin biosynthesis protein [Streptosporangiaceae bacterium]